MTGGTQNGSDNKYKYLTFPCYETKPPRLNKYKRLMSNKTAPG